MLYYLYNVGLQFYNIVKESYILDYNLETDLIWDDFFEIE
jgi:hypothetical protein